MSEFLVIVHSSTNSIEKQKDDGIAISLHITPINDSIHLPGAFAVLRIDQSLILTCIKFFKDAIYAAWVGQSRCSCTHCLFSHHGQTITGAPHLLIPFDKRR